MNRSLMIRMFFALSLGFGGAILATRMAQANPQCDSRDRVTALLAERYGETQQAMGLAGSDAVMELFASGATGTWTITLTLPDGRMCMMASGAGFEALSEGLPAPGDPA